MEKYANESKDVKRTIVNDGIVRFGDRLKEAMNGESNYSLARRCCISEGLLRKYIKGISYPALDNLVSLSIALNKPIEWLAIGQVQSNSARESINANNIAKNSDTTISPTLAKWIDIFNVMDETEQNTAINNIIKNGFKSLLVDIDNKPLEISADNIKQLTIELISKLNYEDLAEVISTARAVAVAKVIDEKPKDEKTA